MKYSRIIASVIVFSSISCSCHKIDGGMEGLNPKNPTDDPSVKPVLPDKDGYSLIWSDEFDGTSLDPDKWCIETGGHGWGNQELQYYCNENVSVGKEPSTGNGCLILTARKEQCGNREFTSARLNTLGKFSFQYGKIEASIMIPETNGGLWPAFWMMGDDINEVGWPKCGEIDIMEMGSGEGMSTGFSDRFFNGALHWGYFHNGGFPCYAKAGANSYSMQDGKFHLFTMIWNDEEVKMYLDVDENPQTPPYFTMKITDRTSEIAPGNYFHKPNFILFNLAVGGQFTGLMDPTQITAFKDGPSAMYVDFVRVYR